MLPTLKQLELRLLLTADPTVAHRALELLAADAKKVDEAAKQAKRAMSDIGPRQPGILSQVGDAVGRVKNGVVDTGKGALALAGTAAGWLAAGAAVAATVANMTHAFGQLDNELLTSRERALGFAKAIPVVGEALAAFISNAKNAVDRLVDPSTAHRLDRDAIRLPVELAQREVDFGYRRRFQGLYGETRDARHRLDAIKSYPHLDFRDRIAMRNPDPLTAAAASIAIGGVQENQDPRVRAAEEAIQMAKRAVAEASYGATSAHSDVGFARREVDSTWKRWNSARERTLAEEKEAKDLDLRAGAYESRMPWFLKAPATPIYERIAGYVGSRAERFSDTGPRGATGTHFSYLDAMNQEQRAEQQARQALQILEEKITASKEKQLTLLQKEAELRKAVTNSVKTQLAIVEEEYAKAKGGAQAFGALSKSEQFDFLDAAKRFQSGGRENVTGDELSRLSANPITSGLVQDRLTRDVKDDPQLKELFQLAGLRDLDTLSGLQRKLKADVDIRVQIDEQQFAAVMAEKLKQMNLKELIGEALLKQLQIDLRRPQLESERGRLERAN